MEQNFKLEFTRQQMEIINAALIEIPFKLAAPVINDINAQLQKQQTSAKESEVYGYTGE